MAKQNLTPLESEEAHTLMQYMHARGLKFTHVKNETAMADKRGVIKNFRALMDYRDGVSPGFPDFIIVLPRTGLLCIELKRKEGGKVSAAQTEWIDALNDCPGVESHVCYGADESIKLIESFYPLQPTRTHKQTTPLPR